jgi:hypothetical protein
MGGWGEEEEGEGMKQLEESSMVWPRLLTVYNMKSC